MIERTDFDRWLERQADRRRVFTAVYHVNGKGFRSWSCGCPLASYCHEVLGMHKVAWAGDSATDFGREDKDGNPVVEKLAGEWAVVFVKSVDYAYVSDVLHAQDALTILRVLDI